MLNVIQNGDEVVKSEKVAILVIALFPWASMGDGHVFGQGHRFRKVNHPDARLVALVDDEQAATDDLMPLKEGRVLEILSKLTQSTDYCLTGGRFVVEEGSQGLLHLFSALYQMQRLIVLHIGANL